MSLVGVFAVNFTVSIVGGALVVLGVVLFVATVMLWRGAAVDPAVLAPLEVMADRRFAKADHDGRLEMLDMHRQGVPDVSVAEIEASILFRAPISQPERPWRDPFPHDDDAVDIVPITNDIIDPLLRQRNPDNPEHPRIEE